MLQDQLYNYLMKFDLFSHAQFGLRKFHSTAGALLDCTNKWYINLDIKMLNLVVLIDLKKAFDTVDHLPAANSDLENVRKWLIANKLRLNVPKTEFILIGSKSMIKNISNSHANVFIENKQIKQVYACKTLGVKIDQNLSWKSDTDEICKKVKAGISGIR